MSASRSPSSRKSAKSTPTEIATSSMTQIGDGVATVARQLRSWSDSVLGVAGAAADVSLGAAKAILVRPEQRKALEKTGHVLRGMREAAGLSLQEVGEAINLKDPSLLELVENGKVALPFEIILRLASVLGRNDPVSFVMRFTRSYNPDTWHALERLGIGRLALQVGREREFANIYRASDAARRLNDDEFGALLAFMKASFELALAFYAPRHAASPAPEKTAPTKVRRAARKR
jgi:transcriptional regulator with XRE-family HTH domain